MKLSFGNFLKRKTEDPSVNTRGNFGTEGKSWYHAETNKFVPITTPYHTQEVFHYPKKFNIGDNDIRDFYTSKNSKHDPDREMSLFRGHVDSPVMDWSDEVVHGMHDKGWTRIIHREDNKMMYIGTNHVEHAATAVKQMVKHGHVSPDHSFQVHLYKYGDSGFGGKVFNLNYKEAKDLK